MSQVLDYAGLSALPEDHDARRERVISALGALMGIAPTPDEKRALATAMRVCIEGRSPEQVARMERERGIGA